MDERSEPRAEFSLLRVLLTVGAILLPLLLTVAVGHALGYRLETTIGDSMNPTLMSGGHWIGKEVAPGETIVRSEIVSFEPTDAQALHCSGAQKPGVRFVKRIVGLPGDRLDEVRHRLFVDGWLLTESYLETPADGARAFDTVVVPAGFYFVLGDDRADSCDSRIFGPVARSQIKDRLVWHLPA